MYGHSSSSFSRAAVQAMTFPFPPQIIVPDQLAGAADLAALSCNSSSSASGSPSYCTMQRSASSHSLPKNGFHHLINTATVDSDIGAPAVRRVFSTGDLQRINGAQCYQRSESSLSNENSLIIESMNRATKYSPEEKKERIDRYRTKRNQRNFNKKIKYACRKTLADSRLRIRGRFARSDEIEKNPQNQWTHNGGEEDDDDDIWINFIDAFPANLLP